MDKYINCIVCGSSDYKILFEENKAQIHQIVECTKCGLMYANPQKKNISETYCKTDESLPPLTDADQEIEQAYNKIKDYKKIAEFINKRNPNRGKVLEVGGFTGIFLNLLKNQGWKVEGLEPDQRAIVFAKDNFGINMHQKPLEDAPFESETFDAAVMLHVIEHLYNPNTGLSIINRLLKHEGMLIIETPTYDTLLFKLLGRRERSMSCNGHIFFFTLVTLKKLLEKHGFKVIKQEKVGRTLTIDRLLWNIGVISKNNSIKILLDKLSGLLYLNKVSIYLNVRDMQRVYCIKDTEIPADYIDG